MDKRNSLNLIASKLLEIGDNKNIAESREIDLVIFSVTKKLDKNIKYEFRNYLYTFGLISVFATPEVRSNNVFIIEKKKINEFLKIYKDGVPE